MKHHIRVLLAECPGNMNGSSVEEALREDPQMEVLGVVHDGNVAVRIIEQNKVDLLLLDLVLTGLDGLGVMQAIAQLAPVQRPVVILYTALTSQVIINRAAELGAVHCIIRPAKPEWILKRAVEVYTCSRENFLEVNGKLFTVSDVRALITKYMHQVGVPTHLKGYVYIRSALLQTVGDPDLLYAVTTKLYPLIAKDYDTHPARVERVIRHAIEATWRYGDLNNIDKLFGYSVKGDRGRPTNTEFLARMTDTIRMQME